MGFVNIWTGRLNRYRIGCKVVYWSWNVNARTVISAWDVNKHDRSVIYKRWNARMVYLVQRIRVVIRHNITVIALSPIVFPPPPHASVAIRILNIAVPVLSMMPLYHSVPTAESARGISSRRNSHRSIHPSMRTMNRPVVSVHPNIMVRIVNWCVSR